MYFVYILENQDKSLYIGFTTNLKRRIEEHKTGSGGRTTGMKTGWKLIYTETYINQKDASGRERFLKSGSGRRYINKQLANYFESQKYN